MKANWTAGLVILGAVSCWSITQEGCGTTPAPTTTATGSGAFGVVTVNGKQELFLPLIELNDGGNGQLAVVDVGLSGNVDGGIPALITDIDLGDAGLATATAGDSSVIVAAGTDTSTVWFIDPTSNKITDRLQLDPSLNQASFSGGDGFVNGIAIDEANHRAILSVWNGLIFVDLGSHKVTGSILAAGAENFGYDSTRQYVLSPYYQCGETGRNGSGDGGGGTPPPCGAYVTLGDAGTVISDGLNLINLKTMQVYTFENPDGGAGAPVGALPDSAAVDTTTGLAIVASEGSGFYTFINLTKASFGTIGDAGFFTAPSTLKQPSVGADDGVAAEPVSHLAFSEQEFSDHISVIDLTKIAAGINNGDPGFGPGTFADAFLPSLPTGSGWSNLGDPHGIAVTTGIQTGGPVGFVVTDEGAGSVYVARIDLTKMLTLGLDGGTMTADQLAPALTLLDANRKE